MAILGTVVIQLTRHPCMCVCLTLKRYAGRVLMLGVVHLQPARVVAALKVLLRAVHACEVVAALEQTVNW